MKLIRLVKLTLGGLLCLFSVSSFAATGWCSTVGGTKIYNFPFVKQFDNPEDNKAGTYFNRTYQWNLGGNYSADCDCTGSAITYYKAEVPGNLTYTRDYDGLHFYSINQYLEVATELWVGGAAVDYFPTPFTTEVSNKYVSACKGITNWSSGNNGYVSLYFTRPFVGQVVIPNTKILDLYGTKVSGSYGGMPMSSIYMSGSVTVPQSCNINAGQVINVNFGNIMSNDIKTKGDIANGFTPKVVNMTLACSNISDGVVVSLSFSGEPSDGDPTALKTDNNAIGVRVRDANDNIVPPVNGRLPVTFDYPSQSGTSSMTLAPMNVTGNAPTVGQFNAVATINAEIN